MFLNYSYQIVKNGFFSNRLHYPTFPSPTYFIMIPGEVSLPTLSMTRKKRRNEQRRHQKAVNPCCRCKYNRGHIRRPRNVPVYRDRGGRNFKLIQMQSEVTNHEVNCHDGFGSSESKDEYISSIKHRLLHQSWIQFDVLHGNSINDLIGEDDPTVHI